MPGNEPWKLLLHERMKELVPCRGGHWKRNVRWWFVHEDMPLTSIFTSYTFFKSLLRAWKCLLPNLVHKHPIWEDEWKRQPICWNPLITDDYGNMLGKRTRLNWAVVDKAFAANVGTWLNFNQSSRDVKELVLKSIRGGVL